MVAFSGRNSIDVDYFFSEMVKLKNSRQKSFHLSWMEFKELMLRETRLTIQGFKMNAAIQDKMELHRIALKERLRMDGISRRKSDLTMEGTQSEDGFTHRSYTSRLQLPVPLRRPSEEIFRRVQDKMANSPWTEPVVEGDMELESGGYNADVTALLIASRTEHLSDEEMHKVQTVLEGPPSEEVMIELFGTPMTRRLIKALQGTGWLNDEVCKHLN